MPVDDPMFEKINGAQWLWYGAQIAADEKDEYELLRDVAEHNAMFWNAEGVEQVRNAREKTFAVSDEDFGSIIEDTFGRKVNLPDKPKQGIMHSIALGPKSKEIFEAEKQMGGQRRMLPETDPSHFLEEELLDDISFTPFQEPEE